MACMSVVDDQPICGECKQPLQDNNADDPSGYPFYCPRCEIIYDWEHLSASLVEEGVGNE